jgi:hypothetical protein
LSLQLVATLVDGQSTCISSAIDHNWKFPDWDDLDWFSTGPVDGWVVVDPTQLSNTNLDVHEWPCVFGN